MSNDWERHSSEEEVQKNMFFLWAFFYRLYLLTQAREKRRNFLNGPNSDGHSGGGDE